ncbi:FxsB family radical SAM/SPASM domain protein, partial [Streptomyces sp. YS-3]
LALGLLRGFRRARFRALRDVADLYALDGGPHHRTGPRREPVPVPVLLAETYERVAVAAYDRSARTLAETRRALEALQEAAELTVSGKSLVADVLLEWEEAARG